MIRRPARAAARALLLATLLAPADARAIALGQIDDFESGTTEGWLAGGGSFGAIPVAPPVVVTSGGPGGAGDAFLQVSAVGGSGAGSRLVAINRAQWAGDYAAAGVTAITLQLRNFGTSDLAIRLLLEDPTAGHQAVTSNVVQLPAGGDWTSAVFPIDAASLTVLQGDPVALLASVTQLRLFHGPLAAFPGPEIAAVLGVDDVTAVPEPASALLLLGGLTLLGSRPRAR